jgi:hypothetical protein
MMAKAAKKSTAEQSLPAGHNVTPTDDAILAVAFGLYLRGEEGFDESKAIRKETHKELLERGLNPKAAAIARKIMRQGHAAKMAHVALFKDVLKLLLIGGNPVETDQLDLLTLADPRQPGDDRAFEEGRIAGLWEKGTEANPYDPTSAFGQAWLRGLNQGRTEFDLVMAMGGDELIKAAGNDDGADPFADAA